DGRVCYSAVPSSRNDAAGALTALWVRPEGGGGRGRQLLCSQYETDHRTGGLLEGSGPCTKRRRTADDDPDTVERVAARRARQAGAERDRYGSRDRRAR